jgi:hypothetical protein
MGLENPKEAEEYIKRHAKGRAVDLGIETSNGKITVDSHKRVQVNHVKMAEVLLKFINTTPGLSMMSRKVMTLKIGQPGISIERLSILCALRKNEIEAYELEGKQIVKDFMRRSSIEDGVNSFEMNKGSLNKEQRYVQQLMRGSALLT